MSIATVPAETYQCGQCDEHFEPPAVEGSFCSSDCYEVHQREKKANKLLDHLKHSHKYCFTCFAQLKVVHRADILASGRTPPDAYVGTQHRTQNATIGETSRRYERDREEIASLSSAQYDYDDPDPDSLVDLTYYHDRDLVEVEEPDPEEHTPDPSDSIVRTGTICGRCGATDHSHPDEDLRNLHPFVIADTLTVRLRESGNIHQIDERQLFEEIVDGATVREAIEASIHL
ncbi:hypothetical protein [Saliphagus sp. LR7]|uniref:hypothetical protein n=1 Tax=Saliphagus sp. LR7 TaxID=2282654 RepID=UPI00130089E2|nr:hypothetical protein [Saliphagus sp. LR7]